MWPLNTDTYLLYVPGLGQTFTCTLEMISYWLRWCLWENPRWCLQSPALLVDEGAGRGRQCRRHAAQYHVVLQRSAERTRFECVNEYGPLRGGGPGMKCLNTLTVTPPGGHGRRQAEGRNETPALPYSGHCTSEVCLNRSASESARRRERCQRCAVRVPERRGRRGDIHFYCTLQHSV